MDIFNKIGDAFLDNRKKVTEKVKDFSELTKLRGQMTTEENRKNAAFLAIGKRFFEQTIGEVSSEYISDFSVINEANANIEELKDMIQEIKKISNCPNCGANNPINSSFCSSCGSKIKTSEKTKEDEVVENEVVEDEVVEDEVVEDEVVEDKVIEN